MVTPTVLRLSGDSFQVSDGGGIELSVSTHKVPPGQVRIQILKGGGFHQEKTIVPDESGLRQMLDATGVPFSDAGIAAFLETVPSLNGKQPLHEKPEFRRENPDPDFAKASPYMSGKVAKSPEVDHIRYLALGELAENGIPTIDWHVEGWLARKDIALFAGPGGIGKSTSAFALGVALAKGEPFCGISISGSVPVLIFDEEQDDMTAARLALRLGAHETSNLKVAVGQGIRLDHAEGVRRLEEAISAERPEVVILDSMQQIQGSRDENSATEVGGIYRELFRLRDKYEVAFVICHHKRKSPLTGRVDALEMVRGSTAHGTQASTVWYATPGETHSTLNLVQVKRRGASKQSLVIRYESEGDDRPIYLYGDGPVEDAETALEKASDWTVEWLADHGLRRRKEIVESGQQAGHTERSLDRALKYLKKLDAIKSPRLGWYQINDSNQEEINLGEE